MDWGTPPPGASFQTWLPHWVSDFAQRFNVRVDLQVELQDDLSIVVTPRSCYPRALLRPQPHPHRRRSGHVQTRNAGDYPRGRKAEVHLRSRQPQLPARSGPRRIHRRKFESPSLNRFAHAWRWYRLSAQRGEGFNEHRAFPGKADTAEWIIAAKRVSKNEKRSHASDAYNHRS